ncbi:UDP-N-acetylglucosamine:LPS N-acetylglucosamine transferase [Gloeobacter kilaueensis JS1]|uniref:UDP-N-acetylglucosamine:LPS N-acetylglucosamine transferase n=1 Tax=Gloeobacter kilaueensis (strain ATCC BAA-2537 / CCAP 1431/1 / ULC 316 / JS1) TaxID=1183438 RepID=U5QIN1_GLOK1|nr:UDP-N-acetylglucosamine:LPS N-acetylglucosamine transferase [Gloeobacter kilaueensis JS1]
MPLKLCLYSSAHAFGHTTRLLAVAAQIRSREPQARLVLNSHVPDWLIDVHLGSAIERRSVRLDVGLVQSDSFTTDTAATIERYHLLEQCADRLVASERDWLAHEKFDAVLADIPPLAGRLADTFRPVWGMSNFGWDFIYRNLEEAFRPLAERSAALYRHYSGLFELPFAEPMTAFDPIVPVPLVVNEARFDRDAVRRALGLSARQPMALMTFGGLGLGGFPAARVVEHPDWQFVVTATAPENLPNVTTVEPGAWRLIELLTAADLALIKPGYSTVAECCALGLPVVSLDRPGFAEAELLIAALCRHLDCRILSNTDFFEQPWDFLDGSLGRRPPLAAPGAGIIAEAILSGVR